MDYLTTLHEKQKEKEEKNQDGFWAGHSIYQAPLRILVYGAEVEALTLVYLYERANDISFNCASLEPVEIKIPVTEETIARKIGYDVRQVRRALDTLDADKCIRVVPNRNPNTGKWESSIYVLLHSTTGKDLMCSPSLYGVCHQNSDLPFITLLKETRELIKGMQKAGRQHYIAAQALASARQSTSFKVTHAEWRAEAMLGRNAFFAGLRELRKNKLLTYKRGLLTLNDPVTKEPSKRTKRVLVYDKATNWEFKFDAVTEQQWAATMKRLLKREFVLGASDWTVSGGDDLCPFCHNARGFRVNYKESKYQCKVCGRYGRLGQLVRSILRVTQWEHVRQYIRETIAQMDAEHSHAGI